MASRKKLCFAVDVCAGDPVEAYLRKLRRVRCISLRELGIADRASDETVIDAATKAGAILITRDKSFTEDYRPMCVHAGIIKFSVKAGMTRLACFKRFLRMPERHMAWKSVTHIGVDGIKIECHDGNTITQRY